MNSLLDRAFALDTLRFGAQGVEFSFARPLPGWAWFLAVVLALALALWSYSRLTGSRPWRVALSTIRAALLLLLLLVISGPQLIKPNERVERDWVLVLLDRSASMTISDVSSSLGRDSRDRQMRDAIDAAWPALSRLGTARTVVWMGFDAGVFDLTRSSEEDGRLVWNAPEGRRTDLAAALDQALMRAAARPVSGVIIMSDGRTLSEPGRAALRRLQSERIPVMAVPLGSADPVTDLAVAGADVPQLAFVNDTVPVAVQVDRLGPGGPGVRSPSGVVRLIDKATGKVLDERPLPTEDRAWADGRTRLVLTTRPDLAGTPTWLVRVIPDQPDLIEENNQVELRPELVDRPVRVAYFDGYPRWEYRYLKNLLVRERSIRSASLLLASNRRYIQEGDLILQSIPRSPEDWAQFDVVVVGDLPSGLFSHEQLEQLKEHVAVRGAGLLWIAGAGSTPHAWRDTPLADLLPFSLAGRDDAGIRPWDEPVTVTRSPGADRLGVLELAEATDAGWPVSLADPTTGWSQLRWAQRIDRSVLKPTAETLAWAWPLSEPPVSTGATPQAESGATPLVLTMRYGAGRVMYVATDEIWRWRYARGESLPERFWLPLIRLQGRESLARSTRSALLEVTPRRAEVQQPVRVSIELLDQALVDSVPPGTGLTIRVTRADGAADPGRRDPPGELTLTPEQPGARGRPRTFGTLWLPAEAGRFRLDAIDPILAGLGISAEAEVALPDDELRNPETDHPLLARLAEQTDGQVIAPASIAQIPELLPNREVRIAGTPDVATLWDRPIVLLVLITLLTLEWVGRRLIKLA